MSARVLISVTHLLGAGHFTRAAALARAFARAGHEVVLASGGLPAPLVSTEGVRLLQLPPLKIHGTAFTALLDEAGRPATPERLAARRDALLDALRSFRPEVILTELFPFGRRVLASEFLPLLEEARRRRPRPLALVSVRDILVAPSKPSGAPETHERLARLYDGVLVHADPSLIPLDETWPVEGIAVPLHYTGYVDEGAPVEPAMRREGVLVSGGSSGASLPLYWAALEAARASPLPWRILVGAGVGEPAFAELRRDAPAHVAVERARPDFRALLAQAAVSVSQTGYNTTVDLLRARVPAVLVPFEGGRETEQRLRAERLAARGVATVLPEAELSAERLIAAVAERLSAPPPQACAVCLEGAEASVRQVEALLAAPSETRIAETTLDGWQRPLASFETVAARPPQDDGVEHGIRRHRHLEEARQGRLEARSTVRPDLDVPALRRPGPDWRPLNDILRAAESEDARLTLWWRDDDATAPSPALDRLLTLAARHGAPLSIASVPGRAERALAERLAGEEAVAVLVHGLHHRNHAPTGEKRAEFGPHRPLDRLVGDAGEALARAAERFGEQLCPVFVPPWNRIAPQLAAALPGLGYRGLSTFGGPSCPGPPRRIDTHLDPIDWAGTRSLADPDALVRRLAALLRDRLGQRPSDPVGLLTHHAAHDEPIWSFCEALLDRLSESRAIRYLFVGELFFVAHKAEPLAAPAIVVR